MGIHGGWLIYQEPADDVEVGDGSGQEVEDFGDDKAIEQAIEEMQREFIATLREEASTRRSRIL